MRNGIPFYDRDEAVRRARRSTVTKAYARQFNDDFTRIMHLRAQEMVPGGRMVFSLLGQRSDDDKPESAILFLEFTNAILHEMASKVLYMSTITYAYAVTRYILVYKYLVVIINRV